MPAAQRIAELIQAYADVIHVVDTDLIAAGRMRYVIAQSGSTLVGMDVERRASTAALLRRIPD